MRRRLTLENQVGRLNTLDANKEQALRVIGSVSSNAYLIRKSSADGQYVFVGKYDHQVFQSRFSFDKKEQVVLDDGKVISNTDLDSAAAQVTSHLLKIKAKQLTLCNPTSLVSFEGVSFFTTPAYLVSRNKFALKLSQPEALYASIEQRLKGVPSDYSAKLTIKVVDLYEFVAQKAARVRKQVGLASNRNNEKLLMKIFAEDVSEKISEVMRMVGKFKSSYPNLRFTVVHEVHGEEHNNTLEMTLAKGKSGLSPWDLVHLQMQTLETRVNGMLAEWYKVEVSQAEGGQGCSVIDDETDDSFGLVLVPNMQQQ